MLLRDQQQASPPPMGTYESLTISAYRDGMALGERKTGLLCPYCHGGGTKERSLSIVVYHDGAQWRCWRASCSRRGRISLTSGAFIEGADTSALDKTGGLGLGKEFPQPGWGEVTQLYNSLTALSPVWRNIVLSRFGIVPEVAVAKGWMSTKCGRLVIPLRAANGVIVGHEFRKEVGEPKSKLNLLSTNSFVRGVYDSDKDKDTVLIVEDAFSALKASSVCRTYALHGTNLTQRHIEELADEWPAKLYLLALDKDATLKASELVKRYALLLPNLRLCPIDRDLKYYFVSEIQQLVESYK